MFVRDTLYIDVIYYCYGDFKKKGKCIGITLFHSNPETVFLDLEDSSFWPVLIAARNPTERKTVVCTRV